MPHRVDAEEDSVFFRSQELYYITHLPYLSAFYIFNCRPIQSIPINKPILATYMGGQ